jgi:hypothetical protein
MVGRRGEVDGGEECGWVSGGWVSGGWGGVWVWRMGEWSRGMGDGVELWSNCGVWSRTVLTFTVESNRVDFYCRVEPC